MDIIAWYISSQILGLSYGIIGAIFCILMTNIDSIFTFNINFNEVKESDIKYESNIIECEEWDGNCHNIYIFEMQGFGSWTTYNFNTNPRCMADYGSGTATMIDRHCMMGITLYEPMIFVFDANISRYKFSKINWGTAVWDVTTEMDKIFRVKKPSLPGIPLDVYLKAVKVSFEGEGEEIKVNDKKLVKAREAKTLKFNQYGHGRDMSWKQMTKADRQYNRHV
jgi:hypothetical protein